MYQVQIPDSINTCHQNIKKTAESGLSNLNNLPCAVLAVIDCEGDQECVFDIHAEHTKTMYMLTPRKPHYQILPYGDTDSYMFFIEDDSIQNFTVVLNSITGDADLSLFKEKETFSPIGYSTHEGYIPDLITVSRASNPDKFKGKYIAKVRAETFASYSIYYYTHSTSASASITTGNQTQTNEVTFELSPGYIIKDYFRSSDKQYKIYSYTPVTRSNSISEDIIITLTSERTSFNMYVVFDLKNITYNETNSYDKISNYIWASGYKSQIVIETTDPNYRKDATYYIIVTNSTSQYSVLGNGTTGFYYLGATNRKTPFSISEGVSHIVSLTGNYTYQNYTYLHHNTSNPVLISLNVYYGRVALTADIQSQNYTNSNNSTTNSLIYINNTDTTFVRIEPEQLKARCPHENLCPIIITVARRSSWDAEYHLSIVSRTTKPQYLQSSRIRQDVMLAGETKNYYAYVANYSNVGVINLSFKSGYGELFAKIYSFDQFSTYPNSSDYGYTSADTYLGRQITFTNKDFKNCNVGCIVMISVTGTNLGYLQDYIDYSIAFFNSTLTINQNQPFQSSLKTGEVQYFNVYFGKNVENVYISLTNMNGDADLYVTYGDTLPDSRNYTWTSSTPFNEYINFSKEDKYFVTRGLNDISGNYTIMVYGFSNTTYTLYITSHPKKIIPLTDSIPANCITKKADDFCYFLYNNFVDFEYKGADQSRTVAKRDYNFVVTTDYLYGSCVIYAGVYNTTNYEIIEEFPSSTFYQYSSIYSNTRRFLKIFIDKSTILTLDSSIMISLQCKEKSFVDLSIAEQFNNEVRYLDTSRENIFYLNQSDNKSLFVFYNWEANKTLDYVFQTYQGEANLKVYKNATDIPDVTSRYVELDNASLSNKDDGIYRKTLQKLGAGNVYFEVSPKTDYGFSLRLFYSTAWNRIIVNKKNSFNVDKESRILNGYFDLIEDYGDVDLEIRPTSPQLQINAYVKFVKYSKDKFRNDSSLYETPSVQDYELQGSSSQILGSLRMKIPKIDVAQGEHARVLINIQLFDFTFSNNITDWSIDIQVNPKVSEVSRLEGSYQKPLFVTLNSTEYQIIDLKRYNKDHDMLLVEISSCSGDFDYRISDKINYYKSDISNLKVKEDNTNGRKLITLENMKSDNYFLTILPKESYNKNCTFDEDNKKIKCDAELTEVMVIYHTDKKSNYENYRKKLKPLTYDVLSNDKIQLNWQVPTYVQGGALTAIPAKYSVYISDKFYDFLRMDSICFLSSIKARQSIKDQENNNVIIDNLEPNVKYYVNILYTNTQNYQIDAFNPIEVYISSTTSLSTTMISKFYINFSPYRFCYCCPCIPCYLLLQKVHNH